MADINLGGSISTTGTSILGHASVVFAFNADHALTPTEYTNNFLAVTSGVSLTGTRNLFAPLTAGQSFTVQNNTTGGQAIQVIGVSGTGVIIANGDSQFVTCDGTNYFTPKASNTSVPWQSSTISTTPFPLSASRDQRWLVDSSGTSIDIKAPTPGGGTLDGDTFTLHWINTLGSNSVTIDGVGSGFKVEDPSNPGQLFSTGAALPSLGCSITWEWTSLGGGVWYILSSPIGGQPFVTYPLLSGTFVTGVGSGYILFTGTLSGNVLLQLNPSSLTETEWVLDFTQVNFNGFSITDIQPTTTFSSWNGGIPNGSITAAGTNPQTNLYRFTLSPGTGFLYATIMTP